MTSGVDAVGELPTASESIEYHGDTFMPAELNLANECRPRDQLLG